MTNQVLLNSEQHRNLRIRTTRCAELGDNQMFALTFVDELRSIQAHYPIFFQKEPQSGDFQPVALLGFRQGENLFLNEHGWDALHIPVLIERQPFLIGLQQGAEQQRVIHLELDSPRVNEEEGEALFNQFGKPTEYLQRISTLLEATHLGLQDNKTFIAMLTELDLLESFSLDIELDNGSQHQLLGFYTIHEDKLAQLTGQQLQLLHEKGYLQAIFMILASHSHLRDLIQRKNQQLNK